MVLFFFYFVQDVVVIHVKSAIIHDRLGCPKNLETKRISFTLPSMISRKSMCQILPPLPPHCTMTPKLKPRRKNNFCFQMRANDNSSRETEVICELDQGNLEPGVNFDCSRKSRNCSFITQILSKCTLYTSKSHGMYCVTSRHKKCNILGLHICERKLLAYIFNPLKKYIYSCVLLISW